MRLVHQPDAEGRLRPVVEPGRPGRPGDDRCRETVAVRGLARHPVRTDAIATDADVWSDAELEGWVDPEYHQRLVEDWELGPRQPRSAAALVVDADPDMRIAVERILGAEGYAVVTCPGPGATDCDAARRGARAERCPRVPTDTSVVVLGAAAEETRLREAYARWLPDADIRHAP